MNGDQAVAEMPADPTAGILSRLDAAEQGIAPAEAPPSPPAKPEPAPAAPPPPKDPGKPGIPSLPKPDAKAPETPAATPPADDDDAQEPVPKSRNDWNTARQKIAAKEQAKLKPELERLKNEIELLRKTGAPKPEIDALVKERDDYRDLIRKIAIDKDPQFNSEFNAKTGAVEGQLKAHLGEEQSSEAIAILKMPPGVERSKALANFGKDLSWFHGALFATQLSAWDAAHAERQSKLEASSKNWEAYQAQLRNGSQQQQVKASQEFEASFQETLREFADSGHEYFKKTGDATHDQEVEQRLALARYAVTGEMTPKEVSQMALYAALTPKLVQEGINLRQELAEAQAQLRRLKGDQPSAARDMGGAQKSEAKAFTTTEALGDHIAKLALEQGAL